MILEKQASYGYAVLGIEVMPDHMHLVLDVHPHIGIAQIAGQIKGDTAHMLRAAFPWLKKRLPSLWTKSKFVSSVEAVTLDMVQKDIETQKGV